MIIRYEHDTSEWVVSGPEERVAFDARADALSFVEQSQEFADSLERKHHDKWERLAPGRWLDAAALEDLPAHHDGSQVTVDAIDDMARNLASAATAPPIDGGGISEPHETVRAGDSKAAGRVFFGVRVDGEDERPHLWLWARLDETVDAEVDDQQWAHGSVAFIEQDSDRYTGEDIGARLVSYALTNFPFTETLEPHAPRARSLRNQPDAGTWLAFTRSRNPMPRNDRKQAAEAIKTAARGPALDKLAELAAALGLELEEGQDSWAKIMEAVDALKKDAAAEAEAEAEPEAERSVVRAVAGLEGEALELYVSDTLAALGDLFGQPDAEPAALLEMLRASLDAFKGALGGNPPAEDAAMGGQDESERAIATAARAEVIGLRARFEQQGKQLAELVDEKRAREIADHIDASFRSAKLSPPQGADREELARLCRSAGADWQSVVKLALRSVNVPGAGLVTSPNAPTRDVIAGRDSAVAAARADIAAKEPGLSRRELRARSYAVAKALSPEAFRSTEQD